MLKSKIEAVKKKLANLWSSGAISSEDYQAALAELEVRSKDYNTTQSIDTKEIVKSAPRVPEVDSSQYQDIDYFEDGVLIPRHIYDSIIAKIKDGQNIFTAKAMYSAFFLLCKEANKQGMVIGLTTDNMASYYGYSDSRNLRNALDKLEEAEIIKIDKRVKPYIYQINNYHLEAGGFVVPEKLMKKVKEMRLKELRLEWLYMCRNHHSPRNESKIDLSLGHIRKVVNAGCYKEVIELAESLREDFFTKVKEVKTGLWRSWNNLKVSFNNTALGIIENLQKKMEEYKGHHLYDSIKYIFKGLEINLSALNFKQAIAMMEEYTERELLIIEQNLNKLDKSYSGSAGYLRHLLERTRNGAIVIQY